MNRVWRLAVVTSLLLMTSSPGAGQGSALDKPAPALSAKNWVNAHTPPSLEGLRGRPVLIVVWGVDCEVCLCAAALEQCAGVDKKFGKRGLTTLGLHVHQGNADVVEVHALRAGVTFPVGSGARNTFRAPSVPWIYLVDPHGITCWEGNRIDGAFHEKLNAGLKSLNLHGEADLPGRLAKVGALVRKGQLGKAVERLAQFAAADGTNVEDQQLATKLRIKLERRAEATVEEAKAAIERGDPALGLRRLDRVAQEYRGHEIAGLALAERKRAATEPSIKALLKAAKLLEKIRKAIAQKKDRVARSHARALARRYPGTVYATRAQAIAAAVAQVP